MDICFVNDTFVEGRGVDTVIFEVAKRLSKKHNVYVFCSKHYSDFKDKAEKCSVDVIPGDFEKLFTGKLSDFSFPLKILSIRKFFKENKDDFDIINLHHATMSPAFFGMKHIVATYHGSPPAYGKTKYPRKAINSFSRFFMRGFDSVISISHYLKKELLRYGIKEEKIAVIPNAVDECFFVKRTEDKDFMLFVGRLEKHKRVEMLIRLSKDIDFKLVVVGTGPEMERLKRYAKSISANVEFLGRVSREKLIDLYASCSFFVSASEWEGFGLIFLEANACGKPVIGFNLCAMPERIIHGVNGFLANDYEEFKKYALLLKENRNCLSKEKIINVAKNYSWENTAKSYEALFRKIIER